MRAKSHQDRRYVVREGERLVLSEVLTRVGADRDALAEGRVFVGRARAHDATLRLRTGDEIRVAGPVSHQRGAAAAPVDVLYDDEDFLCVAKPAGIPTVPGPSGSAHSLLSAVARASGVRLDALTPTSRLDRDVSGVVTFAKSGAAAARVDEARARGDHPRRYVALAAHAPKNVRGEWTWPIGRANRPLLRAIDGREAKPARSRFGVVARALAKREEVMLALAPETGRTHQLRLHASHAGAPLLGDRDYGGPTRIVLASGKVVALSRIALHCARVRVPRADSRGGPLDVVAPVPSELAELWETLGGAPEAWKEASSCDL